MRRYEVRVTGLHWLTANTFELQVGRPANFKFTAGQKVSFSDGRISRDYSLISAPDADTLAICVRHVPGGLFSPRLARVRENVSCFISEAFGYFTFHPSQRQAVCAATGTGIAPFVAYARAGVKGFNLLHGVRLGEELYYKEELAAAARSYVACITGAGEDVGDQDFKGRVTAYLENRLPKGKYDFYLCGRGEMISDAIRIIDRAFEGGRVYTETFF